MKKILSVFIAVLLMIAQIPVLSDTPVTIYLDGKILETSTQPTNVSGSIMVPFRPIFEALGMEINWSEAHQKVVAQKDDKTVILSIGSDKMLVNTDIITIPVAPFIENGSTLVPVRAVCEAMQCTVEWDDANKKVILKTKDYVEPEPGTQPDTQVGSDGAQEKPDVNTNPYNPVIDNGPAYINKINDNLAKDLMNLINAKRAELGIATLTIDKDVCAVALAHSKDMAEYGYFSHTSHSGTNPFDRLDADGVKYDAAAENLASGFLTAQEVLDSWLNSTSHKDIILSNEFTHIGVGYYAGGQNGTYWTLMLIKR